MNSIIFDITKKLDRYVYFTEAMNPNIISWADVLDYISVRNIVNIELIKDKKINIPLDGLYFDSDFIRSEISNGTTFCISKFWNVNNKTNKIWQLFCDQYPDSGVDFHLYGGLTADAQSFPPHNDLAANYIVQLDGSCEWTIYNERASYQEALDYVVYPADQLSVKTVQVLNPGDVIFIPAGTHHQCRPLGKRLSLSIPIL